MHNDSLAGFFPVEGILPRRFSHRAAILFGVSLIAFALNCPSAFAEHAAITLEVIAADGRQAKAVEDEEPPEGGGLPRPHIHVKVGEQVGMQFVLTSLYPHNVIKNATIRYYVVRIDKVGQIKVPPIKAKPGTPEAVQVKQNVVVQGQIVMDLKPKCRVGSRLMFKIDHPGVYLVRVDTRNTKQEHEHFAAIDLEVK